MECGFNSLEWVVTVTLGLDLQLLLGDFFGHGPILYFIFYSLIDWVTFHGEVSKVKQAAFFREDARDWDWLTTWPMGVPNFVYVGIVDVSTVCYYVCTYYVCTHVCMYVCMYVLYCTVLYVQISASCHPAILYFTWWKTGLAARYIAHASNHFGWARENTT